MRLMVDFDGQNGLVAVERSRPLTVIIRRPGADCERYEIKSPEAAYESRTQKVVARLESFEAEELVRRFGSNLGRMSADWIPAAYRYLKSSGYWGGETTSSNEWAIACLIDTVIETVAPVIGLP